MTLQYWYMFPVSIVIAFIAMASGVGGATFFSPLFMIVLGLKPEIAIGTGLFTEVFGFASGLFAYVRKRLIDYKLGLNLIMVTVPMALLGTWFAGRIEPDILKAVLGVGLFAIALSFLRAPDTRDVAVLDKVIKSEYGGVNAETVIVTSLGEEIRYKVCNKNDGRLISGIGGLFIGMISTGLGEMNVYFMLQRCRVPSKVSVATSVFVVAVTALIASAGHFIQFASIGEDVLHKVLSIVIFTVPGVIAGAQFGSRLTGKISQHTLERGIGILITAVGIITLLEVIY